MTDGLTPFARWKERGLFAVVAVALAGYVAAWVLGGVAADVWSGRSAGEQRYARAREPEPLPAGAQGVFASDDPSDHWKESRGRIWVAAKGEVAEWKVEEVELAPPPASVPAPPMLLPVPGPAIECTGDLPRWPAGPPVVGGK